MTEESAALYVVPTPLGNLADLTRRAEEILRTVSWVAAEDTRHSGPLLKQLGAQARSISAHQHNEHEAAARIVEKLQAGEAVALISDAGTPGISDPGARIVAAVRAAGCKVVPLPGPCAATTALSGSGLLDEHFLFYGFLPTKGGQRRQALEALRDYRCALVFYEAPHRVLETVEDMAAVFGERTLVIARELTKLFETIHSLPLAEGLAWLAKQGLTERIVRAMVANERKEQSTVLVPASVALGAQPLVNVAPVVAQSHSVATVNGKPVDIEVEVTMPTPGPSNSSWMMRGWDRDRWYVMPR